MKDSNLSFKNIFKRETKLATYIISVTTILVLGLSYALFFQVNSNSQNQVVKSGDLAFTYSKDGTVLPDNDTTLAINDERCFYPMSEADADSLINTCSYQFSIQNTGTLKAFYQMFLKATESNTANPEHLKVILRESDGTTFNKMSGYPKTVKTINDNEEILLSGDLDRNSSILVYNIQIYLDESLADDADYQSKVISYKLEGKSIVHEDQGITTKPTGAETILGLVLDADPTSTAVIDNGTDASGCTKTLAYDDFGNLRYVGANPCNYVTFNGEEAGWRIIGVFDNQIKLIRSESIGAYSWDTSASSVNSGWGINQWGESGTYTGADLMKLLNPGYDNNLAEDASGNTITDTYANNSLYWNKASGNCYNTQYNAYTTCDFSTTGLTESAKTMIANSTWNLGRQGENNVFTSGNGLGLASKFYEYERSNNNGKICTSGNYCNDIVNRTASWEGYVGLMSSSDYGYAVGGEARTNCLANTNLFNYDTNNCKSNDWLYKTSTYQWTMSPLAHSSVASDVFCVYSDGIVASGYVRMDYFVRPALFLIPSITISGEGTPTDPYTLSVN
ncbi:MAG: hypothetical protein IJ743_05200 [Bacilli bacterium]|nr:hypothetical protein [Bacilli bacterium]MBR1817611.1 hypothetical protein [Bacilli bacterium]